MNNFYSDVELEKLFGKRKTGGTPLFEPQELGWNCPINKKHLLTFSEFNEHLWCYNCEKDYFSLLCPKGMNSYTTLTILKEETKKMLPLMKKWSLKKYKYLRKKLTQPKPIK